MEMIEKCARAICERMEENPDCVACHFDNKIVKLWETYVEDVRTVLQAMREPSAAMIQAGLDDQAYVDSTLHSTWRSMIDEASGERHREIANTDDPGKSGMGEG